MKCLVLTGISKDVLDDLMRRHIKTIELRSAHNIATAMRAEVGDCVFLTSAKTFDVDRGTLGIIAQVTGKEIYSHSLMFSTPTLIQESEMTVVRLKLEVRGVGRVVRVYNTGILDTTEAEVVEVSYFDAR
ncbi:DUF473 domain-containing protein [Archaeoglobus profundus]|uniref:DUF473 domain-containing protein n=1 Tax=Archaeoglobus profundus (strain DSM 5631 / JCM 9629 / NBRC 100127 / Av18) TaxID=572546 RepID=D2RGW2_ARCPA|nr:DUF473 domain-containing protein [Archaeoglobus profundus]ADB57537.1 Protein of unknown function DUF473 [Archaeoglobus profundus DSM 5631]